MPIQSKFTLEKTDSVHNSLTQEVSRTAVLWSPKTSYPNSVNSPTTWSLWPELRSSLQGDPRLHDEQPPSGQTHKGTHRASSPPPQLGRTRFPRADSAYAHSGEARKGLVSSCRREALRWRITVFPVLRATSCTKEGCTEGQCLLLWQACDH